MAMLLPGRIGKGVPHGTGICLRVCYAICGGICLRVCYAMCGTVLVHTKSYQNRYAMSGTDVPFHYDLPAHWLCDLRY
eukprot:3184527-Rhodomonas_salina.1